LLCPCPFLLIVRGIDGLDLFEVAGNGAALMEGVPVIADGGIQKYHHAQNQYYNQYDGRQMLLHGVPSRLGIILPIKYITKIQVSQYKNTLILSNIITIMGYMNGDIRQKKRFYGFSERLIFWK
jgi:hypothetical protein